MVWAGQILATRAQIVKWAKSPTGTYTGGGQNLATDPSGNVFMTGTLSGTATFGMATLTGTAGGSHFLARYDTAGVCQWAKLLDSTVTVGALTTDAAGNFYIAGSLTEGRRDVDGVPRVPFDHIELEVADGAHSGFVAKYNAAGVCQWAATIAIVDGHFMCGGLAVDPSGNIVITGGYGGIVTWWNTATTMNGIEMFVVRCDAAGKVRWARNSNTTGSNADGVASAAGEDVGTDAAGNIYVTGIMDDFESTGAVVSFGAHTVSPRNSDAFIAKYDPTGKCLWAQRAGSAAAQTPESGTGIAVDAEGNSYVTGYAREAAEFGALPAAAASSNATMSVFLAKYDAAGGCKWVKKMPGNIFFWKSHVALLHKDLYITGFYRGFMRFEGVTFRSGESGKTLRMDAFVAKYDTDGSFHWAARSEGTNYVNAQSRGIAVAGTDKIYITGLANSAFVGGQSVRGPIFIARFSNGSNVISGTVFKDLNGNGALDAGEPPVPQTVIGVTPGPLYGISDSKGNYRVNVPPGSYTVQVSAMPRYHSTVAATHQATFTDLGQLDEGNNFVLTIVPDMIDGRVRFDGGEPVRPGFETYYAVTYRNLGTAPQDGMVQFNLDRRYEYISSEPAASVAGSVLSWNYTSLQPEERRSITVKLRLPVSVPLGDTLRMKASLTPAGSDAAPADNSDSLSHVVVGSYDPNDKAVYPEALTPAQVRTAEPLTYKIRFQNKGTAEAFFITLRDTLSGRLDPGSFEMVSASHAYTVKMSSTGVLEWHFADINLPAESADEPGSHGFVEFRIKPKQNLLLGETIENKAFIYFDYNEPIVTNVAAVAIRKQVQTIAFAPVGDRTVGEGPEVLRATATSALPVAFSVTAGNATVAGDKIAVNGPGKVTVKAVQTGNDTYGETATEQTFCALPPKPAVGMKNDAYFNTLTSSSPEGNQWLLNGNPVAGATAESYVVKETGYYTVQVTVNGCSNTSETAMITSVENEQAGKRVLQVYPNPARDQFLLSYAPAYPAVGTRVTIFTTTGVKVAEYALGDTGNNTWQATVPVQRLHKGMYYLVVRDGRSQRSVPLVKE